MSSQRNFGLSLLRAAAISSVVLFHARPLLREPPALLTKAAGWGWCGVDLFFVLSGYLIAGQVAERHDQKGRSGLLREFWIKRWTRTFPLYFSVLFVYFVLSRFDPIVREFHINWRWFVFLQNWHDVQSFPQTWSLCIEEQFYLLFPLFFFSLPKLPPIAWLLPMLGSWCHRFYHAWYLSSHGLHDSLGSHGWLDLFRFTTLSSLDAISVGVFLALTAERWKAWSPVLRNLVAAAGLAVVIAVMSAGLVYTLNPFGATVLYAGLALGFGGLLVGFERWQDGPRWQAPANAVALWSYSIYLWHPLLFDHLEPFAKGLPWLVTLVVSTAVLLGVSFLSYRLIEAPGINLRGRLLGRRRVPAAS